MNAEFQPLSWQKRLWCHWLELDAAGRLPHALLISGPTGVGKHHLLRAFCTALLCEHRGADEYGCGRCASCRQFVAGTHPSLHWLQREPERRDIGIDAIRLLCETLTMTSHNGGVKISVIDPVDALNQAGFNALLKTLEEPPPASHLFLLSECPMALPATVRSRCQHFRCVPPARDEGRDWLARQLPQADVEELSAVLDEASGAPLAALEIWQPAVRDRHRRWRRIIADVVSGESSPLQAADRLGLANEGRDALGAFFGWCYGYALDHCRQPDVFTQRPQLRSWLEAAAIASAATRDIESNVAPQLALEAALGMMRRAGDTR